MSDLATVSHANAASVSAKVPSLLDIGYGNPSHGDDAIGRQVTVMVRELGLHNVEVCAVERLTPELSSKLATVDYAVFVDACLMKGDDIRFSPLVTCGLETAGSSVPGWGLSLHPCSLLALTQSLYCRHPRSWWMEVAAENFAYGQQLSARARQGIQNALEQILALIAEQKIGK
ncbi:Ni,Fe-hydrogenase maturation factor [Rubidibacter lacunae KORDI 51-2]|uniref:Ni,Fe-hydrogenase maturation factor n=1 Tax=Rubidibacter lacunae KORDI 51-2 TaxID=582515 RepID=U5DFB0_9CHRO|nr:Ni,Fe-hydrogenase maturation factor [Rubidibacter lacunae]ERN40291.1 Ni,Fe-hydrogenase maturation factor [Rubidibacter lacunae KORDI 51-2]